MRLRLLHVTPYSADAWAYGGIPRVVGSLTRALASRGHDVTVVTTDVESAATRRPGPAGWRARLGGWPPSLDAAGVTSRIFPNVSNRLAYHAQVYTPLGLDRWLAAHAGDFDVAHLHAHRNLPEVLAARRLTRAGVPYVLAPHGTAPAIERRLLAKHVFDRVAGRRVLDGAARLLAVSPAEVRQLRAIGVSAGAITLVPNPVDLEEHTPAERGRFRHRSRLGSGPVVMFLGKLTPRKRVEQLVAAVARLGRPDVQLVIAGNDMGAEASVRAAVASHGLESRTTFTGLLHGSGRLEALADADVVVYPGEHEIFGLVPLEALLEGTPVVVADDSGCGQVVRATGGGLVVPAGSPGPLADAIARIVGESAAWREQAAAAAVRVREQYAPARAAAAVERVYRRLVCGGAPARKAAGCGVSFVVPVRNGAPWIREVIAAIAAEGDGRPFEIIAVDDGSWDGSSATLRTLADAGTLTLVEGPRRGVAAAMNAGIRAARCQLVAQIDQDVVIEPGWVTRMVAALDEPTVGAVQGRYMTAPGAGYFARVMGLDLAHRYAAIAGRATDHVCTGNTMYRTAALHQVGLFDESLGYGADNDLSYRLQQAGYRLAFCRTARSVHHWRDSLSGYLRQQYGFGYGRLDVVQRHPSRITGDRVSPWLMMLHPAALTLALALLAVAGLAALAGEPAATPAALAAVLLSGLTVERAVAGTRAAARFGEAVGLTFPAVHLLRDLVWVVAATVWTSHRLAGLSPAPAHSMRPRQDADRATTARLPPAAGIETVRSPFAPAPAPPLARRSSVRGR
ncbi:MAG TPA: glycosyltransferase [Vicinamibacterales bacterium]|nr:glycosyltransferase [Vicinamibacterales bacterium]